ncbi:c-type cytochrome [Silvibacterium sp.]|uniref:c-type cytochrome n=1 Tax=Silvibacterium sp. TaxID=1964179 RepID=UPI0039E700B4
MNHRLTAVLLLCGASCAIAALAAPPQQTASPAAQTADASGSQSHAKTRNLKALPADISGKDLHAIMFQYQKDLGAPCEYCHEMDPDTKKIDYASDQNPVKETARFMIVMTNDINNKYLSQLGDRRYASPITCGSCHQGQVEPPDFDKKPDAKE